MAQTKRKRKRRHRGTQAGTIDRAGRTSKPTGARASTGSSGSSGSRAERSQTSRDKRQQRLDTPPTWRGALNRAAFAAAILVIFVTITQKNLLQGAVLGAFAMLIYIPMSYYTDRALYNRRQRQKQRRGR